MKLPVIAYVDLVSIALPVVAGGLRYRRLGRAPRIFYGVAVAACVCEYCSWIMGRHGIHNLWLLQVYHFLAAAVTMYVFAAWRTEGRWREHWRWIVGGYALLWAVAKCTFEPITMDDTYTYTAACVILTILAVDFIMSLARREEIEIPKVGAFWIASGILLYYAGNIALFSVFSSFILLGSVDAVSIWTFHWGIDTVVNLAIAAGFLIQRD